MTRSCLVCWMKYLHPDRLAAVSISAPGRPTFLDWEKDYYWGVKDWKELFGTEIDLEAMRKVPVQILVGGEDRKPIGEEFCGGCRVDRMKYLQNNFLQHQIAADLEIIPGIGHSDGGERIFMFHRKMRPVKQKNTAVLFCKKDGILAKRVYNNAINNEEEMCL